MEACEYGNGIAALRPEMVKYAKKRLQENSADAEDVVQNALVRLWDSRDRYNPARNLKRWVMTFFINELRRYWRDGERQNEVLFDHREEKTWLTGPSEETNMEYAEVQDAIRELAETHPRRADILVRYYWAGENGVEIGEALGLSKQRVYQLRTDAEDRLARMLGGRRCLTD